jgi:hypothetical protein
MGLPVIEFSNALAYYDSFRRERLPANFGKPWTSEEDQAAIGEFDSGLTLPEMARRHLRTQSSIRLRLEKLGKIEPTTTQ